MGLSRDGTLRRPTSSEFYEDGISRPITSRPVSHGAHTFIKFKSRGLIQSQLILSRQNMCPPCPIPSLGSVKSSGIFGQGLHCHVIYRHAYLPKTLEQNDASHANKHEKNKRKNNPTNERGRDVRKADLRLHCCSIGCTPQEKRTILQYKTEDNEPKQTPALVIAAYHNLQVLTLTPPLTSTK